MSDVDTITKQEVANTSTQNISDTEVSNNIEKQQSENEEDVDMDDLFGEEEEEKEGSEQEEENKSDQEDESDTDYQQEIKIAEAELPKHIVPYKSEYDSEMTMQSRLPPFLKIDTKNFDPQQFLQSFNDRVNDPDLDVNDKINMSLFDESTMRWRYTKDPKTGVITKESNATIVEWEDGSMSLKIGDEYCDIIRNELECSLMVKTYQRANLLQTTGNAGIIKEKCMFVPSTMKSNLHKRLAKAVQAQSRKENDKMGPKTVYIKNDPARELEELERQQDAIARQRRRDLLKEEKRKEKQLERMADGREGYKRSYKSSSRATRSDNEEEYADDDEYDEDDEFVANDDESEEELAESEEEEYESDDGDKGDRLSKAKSELAFKEDDEQERSPAKKRKVVVEDDEE
ncbi:hypothetical protein FOG48_01265 [Hanseniaspora uvarum]|nr:hypothetical protein FOG48_01265 [Hanseniaspora uvarum]GMM41515.1 Leo1 protein [Hanseniaspora uvarum]